MFQIGALLLLLAGRQFLPPHPYFDCTGGVGVGEVVFGGVGVVDGGVVLAVAAATVVEK